MFEKTKMEKSSLDSALETAKEAVAHTGKEFVAQTGVAMMGIALATGLVEAQEQHAVLVEQPSYVQNTFEDGGNNKRRESHETSPLYVGYSLSQRTPSRAGKPK